MARRSARLTVSRQRRRAGAIEAQPTVPSPTVLEFLAMQVSGVGAVVGSVIGGLARGTVVLFHTGASSFWLAFPSAGIGALVGAIAGASAQPRRGALIGGLLSAAIFGLLLLSGTFLMGRIDALLGEQGSGASFLKWGVPYLLEMTIAGAFAGWAGATAGKCTRIAKPGPLSEHE